MYDNTAYYMSVFELHPVMMLISVYLTKKLINAKVL